MTVGRLALAALAAGPALAALWLWARWLSARDGLRTVAAALRGARGLDEQGCRLVAWALDEIAGRGRCE